MSVIKKTFNISGFSSIYTNNSCTSRGRLAFFIRDGITFTKIKVNQTSRSIEAIGITIYSNKTQFNMFNFYIQNCQNQGNINVNYYEDTLQQYKNNLIVVGDFNSYNTLWGSKYTGKLGIIIAELINNCFALMMGQLHTALILTTPGPVLILQWSLKTCQSNVIGRCQMTSTVTIYPLSHQF